MVYGCKQDRTRMAARCFLVTYRPLVKNRAGRQAIREHALLPFVDGSCRREPDFEARFPSITATCRGGLFAPRLRAGDRVAYLTVKGKYFDSGEFGWHLVAVLRIIRRFESHNDAAAFYEKQGQPLPSNCFVNGNPPKPYDWTNRDPPKRVKHWLAEHGDFGGAVRLWDKGYRGRIERWPVFLAAQPEFLELSRPPLLREAQMREIFFPRIPSTRNPPQIDCEQLERLVHISTNPRSDATGRNAD